MVGMKNYMIDIELPEIVGEEFFQLIPDQRAYVNRMMREGIIKNYSLSIDRKKLWVVINAISLAEARHIIARFPIFYFIKYTIHDLLIHDSSDATIPQLWLN